VGTFIGSNDDPLRAAAAGGVRSRRTRSKEATRGALVAAADTLFDEVGYSAARTNEIARRANVAQATLFRYFETKADLAAFRLRRTLEEFVEAVLQQPAGQAPHVAIMKAVDSPGVVDALSSPAAVVECERLTEHAEVAAHLCWVADGLKKRLSMDLASRLAADPTDAVPRALSSAVMDTALDALRGLHGGEAENHPNRLAGALWELRPLFLAVRAAS